MSTYVNRYDPRPAALALASLNGCALRQPIPRWTRAPRTAPRPAAHQASSPAVSGTAPARREIQRRVSDDPSAWMSWAYYRECRDRHHKGVRLLGKFHASYKSLFNYITAIKEGP